MDAILILEVLLLNRGTMILKDQAFWYRPLPGKPAGVVMHEKLGL